MPTPFSPITRADLQALAALANAKLLPATPYQFAAFASPDQLSLPPDISPAADYAAGHFADGSKVTVYLYAYKTIAGTKSYTPVPLLKAFTGAAGSGDFSVTWTWVSAVDATAPEGYLLVIPRPYGLSWQYFWQDLGNVQTFTEDGTFSDPAWKADQTLDAENFGSPLNNLPCGHGTWLKTLNRIRKDFFAGMDLFGGGAIEFDADFLVSGPWCVSVAPKCYLYLGAPGARQPGYAALKFIYSEADSLLGNELAPEADLLRTYIGAVNGANNLDWDANVLINGRIIIFSAPQGQAPADWHLAASHPGITISFDAHYVDGFSVVTAFIFDCVNVQYTVGTPVVLTATPLAGGSVIAPGNPVGQGAWVNCVFTGDKTVYATADAIAIHPGGGAIVPGAAKSASLPSTLNPITLSTLSGAGVNILESHYRCFCPGVFKANTLPTAGVMTYLDVDLPQYRPSPLSAHLASGRRQPRNDALPYQALVDNRGAGWPVFRDTDFTPDSFAGKSVTGSLAWQIAIATKNVVELVSTDDIDPYEPAEELFNYSIFVPTGTTEARFYADDPNVTLFARAGDFPTLATHDASAPGGTWLSLAAAVPGFATNTLWFFSIYNPTTGALTVTTTAVVIGGAAPNGTFFPTGTDDAGNPFPLNEGYSYHFPDPATGDPRPIPTLGYCVYSLNLRRRAGASTALPLDVKIGLMKEFGFETDGVFSELQTFTIPAGEVALTVEIFWTVLSGAPLVYQCDETVPIRAAANFQPMLHATFSPATTQVFGADQVIGFYNGPAWFETARALLFFTGGDLTAPIVLPVAATIYNDLTAVLGLL